MGASDKHVTILQLGCCYTWSSAVPTKALPLPVQPCLKCTVIPALPPGTKKVVYRTSGLYGVARLPVCTMRSTCL